MNLHNTYFLIHAAAIAGPLLLSFDRKVAFYKKWKYLFPAMILPAVIFIIWDHLFTRNGVWGFNEQYITGWKLGALPVEELLFFITVPYCCMFIYECIRSYFPKWQHSRMADAVLLIIGIVLLVTGVLHLDKAYTSWTFLLLAGFIMAVMLFKPLLKGFDSYPFLAAFSIILVPFLIVNGFLTAIPVVVYNNAENLSFRIFSFFPWPMHNIPVEDIFYGMLLILMNVVIYELLKSRSVPSNT